jgi:hypothetical protein
MRRTLIPAREITERSYLLLLLHPLLLIVHGKGKGRDGKGESEHCFTLSRTI